jgi:hypothetical protein
LKKNTLNYKTKWSKTKKEKDAFKVVDSLKKKKKNYFCFFPFFFSPKPEQGTHRIFDLEERNTQNEF